MLPWKRILAPVDFSDRSLRAAEHAAALARRFDARLIIAHVIDRPPYEGRERESFYKEHGEGISAKELDCRLLAKLREFAQEAAPGVPAEQLLLRGDPAREIEKLAQ